MREGHKQAAALKYSAEYPAPKLIAKGQGKIAERILQIAEEHGIPVKEDAVLTEALSAIDLYQEIPPELYKAVAEILAFIFRITDGK